MNATVILLGVGLLLCGLVFAAATLWMGLPLITVPFRDHGPRMASLVLGAVFTVAFAAIAFLCLKHAFLVFRHNWGD